MSKINQNWIFGDKSGLNFADPNNPIPISSLLEVDTSDPNQNPWHNEGCASISDSNGNLLFYTNGINVWKVISGIHSLLLDSSSSPVILKGHSSSTQSAILVPDPSK
ncbi:MAG: hypothetical protein IPL65_10500 [Lewinellaceae bacterium]|nr:hypothetical protein [Lewinellaceae bacterium]